MPSEINPVVRLITLYEFADGTFDVRDSSLRTRGEAARVTAVDRDDAYDFINQRLYWLSDDKTSAS